MAWERSGEDLMALALVLKGTGLVTVETTITTTTTTENELFNTWLFIGPDEDMQANPYIIMLI